MAVRFTVLASGSSGNAAFLNYHGFGLLIDAGLGPRLMGSRLATIGMNWNTIHAVLLTHTHGDHWKDRTLAQLRAKQIMFYCHPEHHTILGYYSEGFRSLLKAGLVRDYECLQRFEITSGLHALPVPVPHDSEPTYAFSLAGSPRLFGSTWSLGYASDLGCVTDLLLNVFRDVHVLAIEFNHDVTMQLRSARPQMLIDRVLSDEGHLSNKQAAAAVRALVQSPSGSHLRQLIQLHLSRECNRESLAVQAAQDAIRESNCTIDIHTAHQDIPTHTIDLEKKVS